MQNVKYVNEPLQAYIIPSSDAHQVGLIRSGKYLDNTITGLVTSEKHEDVIDHYTWRTC
jgi:hypothetical protein